MIDTNVRSVKRTETGATTLTKATSNIKNLCNHCALLNHCDYRVRLTEIERAAKMMAPVTTCSVYQYPIHFVNTIGIDVPGFNTIRIGEAWAKRLHVGDHVGLLNHDKQLVLSTRVTRVEIVAISVDGLKDSAQTNHMLIAKQLGEVEAAEKLLKILRNNYGKLVFEGSKGATVIAF
jgi:hypothetical protein